MARLVSRRPAVGFGAGAVFAALGLLLLDLGGGAGGRGGAVAALFTVSGFFFLFVAAMSFLASLIALARSLRNKA